jgi:cytoskeleton protein RodZ
MKSEETIGEYLKQIRLSKGISLEEIASETKINVTILDHLENDRFEELPAAPFVKGFIRAYAKFVGADFKEAVMIYEEFFPSGPEQYTPIDKLSHRDGIKLEGLTKYKLTFVSIIVGITAIVLVLSVLAYKLLSPKEDVISKIEKEKEKSPSMVVNLNRKKEPDAVVSAKSEGAVKNKVQKKEVKKETAAADKKASSGMASDSKAAEENSEKSDLVDKTEKSSAADNNKEVTSEDEMSAQNLKIRAKSLVWVKVQIDDNEPYDFMLGEGKLKKLAGQKEIKLLIGDASALEVTYGGKDLGNLGNEGVVKSIVFPGLGKWKNGTSM